MSAFERKKSLDRKHGAAPAAIELTPESPSATLLARQPLIPSVEGSLGAWPGGYQDMAQSGVQ